MFAIVEKLSTSIMLCMSVTYSFYFYRNLYNSVLDRIFFKKERALTTDNLRSSDM